MSEKSFIIQLNNNLKSKNKKNTLLKKYSSSIEEVWPELNLYTIKSNVNLKKDSNIVNIFENNKINFRKGTKSNYKHHKNTSKQWCHDIMKTDKVWDNTISGKTKNGFDIYVGIIEDGFYNHNNLQNIFTNDNFSEKNDIHGTHVSGIIVTNNKDNVHGINKDLKIVPISSIPNVNNLNTISGMLKEYYKLYNYRVKFNKSNGKEGYFIVAVNNSWGFDKEFCTGPFKVFNDAFDLMGKEGILNCGATANNNINIDEVGDIPTSCKSNFLISVTNSNKDDDITSSGYGVNSIDISAPGTSIYSTLKENLYGYLTGTSMATPQVTGTIALIYSVLPPEIIEECMINPSKTALDIKNIIINYGIDKIEKNLDKILNGGRLNVYKSIQKASVLKKKISCEYKFNNNWQLIGVPFQINNNITRFFNENKILTYNNKYQITNKPENYNGYWISDFNKNFIFNENTLLSYYEMILKPNKWYLISGLSYESSIKNPSNNYIMYEYDINLGYLKTQILKPGIGYWIRSTVEYDILIKINLI